MVTLPRSARSAQRSLGAGPDWVVTGGPGIEGPEDVAEIRLFLG
jgi:hypothetical protein